MRPITLNVRLFLRTAAALLTLLLNGSFASAQCESWATPSPEPQPDDFFSTSVAISGEFSAAGWYNADINGSNSGAVVIYRRDALTGGWQMHEVIVPPDNQTGDGFGYRVAMNGSMLIASSYGDDDLGADSGSAHIFRLDPVTMTWQHQAKLLASDGVATAGFGYAVDIEGDLAVVGAHRNGGLTGEKAYIYRKLRSTWSEMAVFGPEVPFTEYGLAVAIDRHSVFVSGWQAIDYDPPVEWVDVFEPVESACSWERVNRLMNPLREIGVGYGWAIDACDGFAIIGSIRANAGLALQGAFVYRRSPLNGLWDFEQRLDAGPYDGPGLWITRWVAINEDAAVIGEPVPASDGPGQAFTYSRNAATGTWSSAAQLEPSGIAATTSRFGIAVALEGDRAIVAAPDRFLDGAPSNGFGTVHFLDLHGLDCNRNAICDNVDIASGTSSDRNQNGVPDKCEQPWDVNADGMVSVADLMLVIESWGACPAPPQSCPADVDFSGQVDVADLLAVIGHWS